MRGDVDKSTRDQDADIDELTASLANSIDKSRKRLLSPRTLRGDQAVDRLASQEASASPLLKKSKLRPTMTLPPEFYTYMDQNITKRFDNIEADLSEVKEIRRTLADVHETVTANSAKIGEQDRAIKMNRDSIAAIRDELRTVKNLPPSLPSSYAAVAASSGPSDEDDRAFNLARRSVRLWPVSGSSREQLWRETHLFLHGKLGLTSITEDLILKICRPDTPSGAGSGIGLEVLVEFRDVSTRDNVLGASSKLAAYVDQSGKPTAGIRIEVPRRLRSSFSILYKYGQKLRLRHGVGTRRHVKFDDLDKTLFLNVRLPGDEAWSRVSIELARKGLRTREMLNNDELERRLDIAGPASQRPRAASLSAPMDSDPVVTQAWSGRASISE